MERALFFFRRDLRLEDNRGLLLALSQAKEVLPAFCFTKEQTKNHPYKSAPGLQFLIESLQDLEKTLQKKGARLYLFYESPEKIVAKCAKKGLIDAVFVNRDYTPYSKARDARIEKACHTWDIPFLSCNDALLLPPEETVKKDGTPYTIFTPFYKHALLLPIEKPHKNSHTNYYKKPLSFAKTTYPAVLQNPHIQKGGRTQCRLLLQQLRKKKRYAQERDYPALDATSHLSPHLKFTTYSPREIYWHIATTLGKQHPLLRSLYWRDFFSTIAHFFPHVFEGPFHKKFRNLRWKNTPSHWKAWTQGKTGFPLVDAGIRELLKTGTMHNRVRMIVASFLVKDLHIDWRKGEQFFARHLTDYDPSVNNGNWQWVASTGCDAQPYFRIFNPWAQQKKFDPDATYIRTWVEELRHLSPKEIHTWHQQQGSLAPSYPRPLVDHAEEASLAKKLYAS